MKELGLAKITTDAIIAFPKGTKVMIDEYEVGDESDSVTELTEQDFADGHCTYLATVDFGRGSSYSVDVEEHEFQLIEPDQAILGQ